MRRLAAFIMCIVTAAVFASCHDDPGWKSAAEIETELERKYSREFTLLSETDEDDKTVWTFADSDGIECRVIGEKQQNIAVDLIYSYNDDYPANCLWTDYDKNFAALEAEGIEFSRYEDSGTISINVPDREQYYELLDAGIKIDKGNENSFIGNFGVVSVKLNGQYVGQLDELMKENEARTASQSEKDSKADTTE